MLTKEANKLNNKNDAHEHAARVCVCVCVCARARAFSVYQVASLADMIIAYIYNFLNSDKHIANTLSVGYHQTG